MKKIKTTIRCTLEVKAKLEKVFTSFYKGAEIAANSFPYLRVYALEKAKEKITDIDFENINKLVQDQFLNEEYMVDPVIMLRSMSNQQSFKELDIDFFDLKTKLGDMDPILLFFVFLEIKRFRDIKKDVPSYKEKQFFNEDMK
jgi:hypothetical protein